jgi:hypothetical protein
MSKRLALASSSLASNELLSGLSALRVLRYEDVLWGIEFPVNRLVRLVAEQPRPPATDCDWKGDRKAIGTEVSWGELRLRSVDGNWERQK